MKLLQKFCAATLCAALLVSCSAVTGLAAEVDTSIPLASAQAPYINWWTSDNYTGICNNTQTGVDITSYPRKTLVATADVSVEAGKTYYVSADFQAVRNGVYGTVLFGGETVLTSADNGADPKNVGFLVTPDSNTLTLTIEALPFQNEFTASNITVTPLKENNLIDNNNWTFTGQGSLERLGASEFSMLNFERKTALAVQNVAAIPGKTYIVSGYFKTLFPIPENPSGAPVSNVTLCGNTVLSADHLYADYHYVSFPVVTQSDVLQVEIAALPFASRFQFKDISVQEV